MNFTTAVLLVNKNIRLIAGIYEAATTANPNPPRALFKTLDPTIKEGDYVLVPTGTRHLMTVNKVVAVDVEPDFDSSTPIGWMISKIDRAEYERTVAMEAEMIEAIRSAEKNRRREELRQSLIKDTDGIAALQIANATGVAAIGDSTKAE